MSQKENKSFVQLHAHSFFSILDGCGSIENYINKAKEFNHSALAITEHGNLSSSYEFYKLAKKNGIKPILGCEFYMAKERDKYANILDLTTERHKKEIDIESNNIIEEYLSIEKDENESEEEKADEENEIKNDKDKTKILKQFERERYHQIVLVKNEEGWKNICKLNYYSFQSPKDKAYQEDKGLFYYKPMIRRPYLFEAKNGLIITSSCMVGEINRYIREGLINEAYELLLLFKENFKDDFYLEIQLNEIDKQYSSQKIINTQLIEFAKTSNTKIILTSDSHYVNRGEDKFQDVMLAIAQGKKLSDKNKEGKDKLFTLDARSLFFHSKEDFYSLNEEYGYNYTHEFIDECLDNTLEVSDKVNFEFKKEKNYPKFYSSIETSKQKLKELIKKGFIDFVKKWELTDKATIDIYKNRIKYEYDIIEKNDFVDYFLVVWDIARFCAEKNIARGPGRGSASASLLLHLLGVTKLDPIKSKLYFERFINPEALSVPDVDCDFDSERRYEILDYLKEKYGEENVVQIANMMTFNVKSAIKDLMRVLGRRYEDSEFLTSELGANIPEDLVPETIDEWFKDFQNKPDAKSRRIYDIYNDNQDVIEYFKKIHGEVRNLGVHAGGVLITPKPIYEYIPVNKASKALVTAYTEAGGSVAKEGKISREGHKNLSELGLLKLDILGLKTVTVIRKIIELVKKTKDMDIANLIYDFDPYTCHINYPEIFDELCKGDNKLIFQFESTGINEVIKEAQPRTFAELSAINSLYRPGPMESGATKEFAQINSGKKEPTKIHPLIDDIISNTGYVIAFQEQVSRIINACTGISNGIAEKMRRSIMERDINKYPELLVQFKETFVLLAIERGIDEEIAKHIQNYLMANAGYAFAQPHADAYSLIALQALYLKIYYPEEFYCVCLSETNKDKELFDYISHAMKNDIVVDEPLISKSEMSFVPIEDKKIACGFSLIKGIGKNSYEELISHRDECKTFLDYLMYSWNGRKFNKGNFLALIKVGAFKELESNMKVAVKLAEYHFENKKDLNKLNRKKEVKYSFEMLEKKYENLKLDLEQQDFTDNEKDSLWLEVTGFKYPFRNKFLPYMDKFNSYNIVGVSNWSTSNRLVYGEILDIEQKHASNHKPFYKVKLSDFFTDIIVKVWDNQYKNDVKEGLKTGNIVCMELDKNEFGFSFLNKGKFISVT